VDGSRVWVKRGTKGGKPRYPFLHDARQVAALDEARRLTGGGCGLIPKSFATYEQWRQHVYGVLRAAGISRAEDILFHDLRRTYIVERMKFLILQRRLRAEDAAKIVAREVGHHRTEVLNWYLDATWELAS